MEDVNTNPLSGLNATPTSQPPAQPPTTTEGSTEGLTQTQRGGFGDPLAGIDDASAMRAADAGVTGAAEGEVIYSSHPIQRFKVGRFVFENSVLRLNEQKDKDDFEQILKALSPRDRLNIRKLSLDKVDELVRQRAAATRQFDSSVGREAIEALRSDSPTIGREDISHAARPQADHNVPVTPTNPVDQQGTTGVDQGPHNPPAA